MKAYSTASTTSVCEDEGMLCTLVCLCVYVYVISLFVCEQSIIGVLDFCTYVYESWVISSIYLNTIHI